ncbi:pirin family protein [Thalassotalea nanhaiensis]|uniref:Pirin family protein n=1 Tax=Thalassotalea nanhaiensis TaxID=3065648 RepID=A0ABY9TGJ6_9GAMM|nr:pirin family protein [Colwelliaceae bacterium SQ345]
MSTSNTKELQYSTAGIPTSDGAGVNMTRIIGSPELNMLDPFLLLDAFGSDKPNDYLAGFPEHPHRGFETVTYMLEGKMRHKDNAGNEGVIEQHGVQWMTAGKGIVHSEMPEQTEGLLAGFQLWVNLPKAHKMTEPKYQEFKAADIPVEDHDNGSFIRVIAGKTQQGTLGVINNEFVNPTYLDVTLKCGETFNHTVSKLDNSMIYMIEGDAEIGSNLAPLAHKQLGILTAGTEVIIKSKSSDIRFLFISAVPLNEPVARGGPFVMNTKAEIVQAFDDFSSNKF